MANRKQQKRKHERAKAHSRGTDVVHDDGETQARPARKPAPTGGRGFRRAPQPPSPKRAVQRAAVFGVIFFVLQHFTGLGGKTTTPQQLAYASWVFIGLFAVGLLTDRFVWRRYLKQTGQLPS